jgi:ribosomal protein L29
MKIKELRAMGENELKQKMTELYKELMKDNAQVATGTIPKNPGKLRLAKKTIARIKTIISQKEKASPAKADGAQEAAKKA